MSKRKKKPSRSKNAAPRTWRWWTGCLGLVAAIAGIGLLDGQKDAGDQQVVPAGSAVTIRYAEKERMT